MSKLKWCPNCNQNVSPQKNKGNRGGTFALILILGIFLSFYSWTIGLVVLIVAAVYLVVGLMFEIGTMAGKSSCPICKAKNLLDEK